MQEMTAFSIVTDLLNHFSLPNATYGWDSENHICVYRGGSDPHSNVKCAFGVIIQDCEYSPEMENMISGAVLENYALGKRIPEHLHGFINDLQTNHDRLAVANQDDVKNVEPLLEYLRGVRTAINTLL